LKNIAAILLPALMLFNWFGYRMIASWGQTNADSRLEAQLDLDQYDASELICLKIPTTKLPYCTNSIQYERVKGDIEIQGVLYKYCKRRLYHDSLELLCIPNQAAMKSLTTREDFFRIVNDLQRSGQGKKPGSSPSSTKNLLLDYFPISQNLGLGDLNSVSLTKLYSYPARLSSQYSATAEQPPEILV
jgi:hypothetical protein